MEVIVEAQNVGVPEEKKGIHIEKCIGITPFKWDHLTAYSLEMWLNLNFPPELMLHTLLFHLGLKQHLQCHNGLQLLHPSEIDITELPLS